MERKYFHPSGTVSEKGGPMIKYHTSTYDGTIQPYAVYVPSSYTPEKKWPLVISLHGYSSDHVLNLRRVFGLGNKPNEPDAECKQSFPPFPEIDCLTASPYAFGSIGYGSAGETDILDVLAEMKNCYNIDEDRVYLTGLSMGGEGAWHMAVRFPDIWAAVAPVCASMGFFCGPEDASLFAKNLLHVPAHISHGTDDSVVPVANARKMREIMDSLNYTYEYKEYPNVDHNSWDYTYANAGIFPWFLQFKRVRKPSKVIYTTDRLRYNSAYWVEITNISAWNMLAHIEAEVLTGNVIEVSASNITAFKLNLAEAPVDITSQLTVICNGQEVFKKAPEQSVIEIILDSTPTGRLVKRKGLEGPVYDALKSKNVIVYGANTDDSEYRNILQCTADFAVFWTDWGDIETQSLADYEVNDEIIANYNLILLGNADNNSILGKINDQLPVRFTNNGVSVVDEEHTGDLGFVLVYPNPLNTEKYVVVLGGNTEDMLVKASTMYRNMPDCVVFSPETDFLKPETFITYGYFDENWGIS